MKCPKCGAEYSRLRVVDSRPSVYYGVRRRRECEVCGTRFTTCEISQAQKAKFEKASREKAALVDGMKEMINKYFAEV